MNERDEVEISVEDEGARDRDGSSAADRSTADAESRRRPAGSLSELEESAATELADELGRIDLHTTPEGYVEARVTDLAPVDEATVSLTVALPTGRELSFDLEKPVPWSDSFLLARLVEHAGYDAASVDHLVGEHVLVERIGDRGETARPPTTGSDGTSIRSVISALLRNDRSTHRWRLVDPRELASRDEEDAPALSRRLGMLTAGYLLGVGVLGLAAATGALGGLTFSGVLVGLVGFVVLTVAFAVGSVWQVARWLG